MGILVANVSALPRTSKRVHPVLGVARILRLERKHLGFRRLDSLDYLLRFGMHLTQRIRRNLPEN